MTADSDTSLASDPPAKTDDQDRRQVATSLRRVDRLAHLMDEQFELPVVRYRIGLDPLLGLLPGGGDWVAWVAGVYIMGVGARLNVPPRLLGRMALNVMVDLVTGYVPVAGDLFDAGFKSNRKNVDLLFDHFDYDPSGGSDNASRLPILPDNEGSRVRTWLVALALIAGLALAAAVPFLLLWWLLQ